MKMSWNQWLWIVENIASDDPTSVRNARRSYIYKSLRLEGVLDSEITGRAKKLIEKDCHNTAIMHRKERLRFLRGDYRTNTMREDNN